MTCASRGIRVLLAAVAGVALCAATGAYAAGTAVLLTAEFGKTTYRGDVSRYDAMAVQRVAGTGVAPEFALSSLDRKYTQSRPRSYGLRWQDEQAGIEIGYYNLARASYTATGQGATGGGGMLPLVTDMTLKSRGPALSILGIVPLSRALQLEIRGGVYYGKTRTAWSTTLGGIDAGAYSDRKRGFSALAGSALTMGLGDQSALSLGYARFFDIANRSVERWSLGVSVVLREP